MLENLNEPQSRTEKILQNVLGVEYDVTPQSRVEILLTQIFEGGGAGKGGFEVHICSTEEYDAATKIPTIATPDPKTLYLVPSSDTAGNLFDEYIYVDNKWEKFGGVQIEGWAKNIVDGTGSGAVKTKYASKASGKAAFAEGDNTTASGNYSHAEGQGTIAASSSQHAGGKYNIADANNTYAEIVGNGESDSTRSNARTLDWSGNEWLAGTLTLGQTTLTEADIIALHTPAEGGEY